MQASSLQGRRVVVTGGFGALGRAVVAALRQRGAHVAAIDRAESPPVDGASSADVALGGVDLTDAAATATAFAHAAEGLGGIDALVNVAGGFAWEAIEGGDVATWDRLYQVNVRTAVIACQQALAHMTAGADGRIVNVGALAAQKAGAGMGAYAASKAGVARLTEALAEELKDRGITVNAVLPSILDTPANRADMPQADAARWVGVDQLAAVVAFLLGADAKAITGALIPVAGRV